MERFGVVVRHARYWEIVQSGEFWTIEVALREIAGVRGDYRTLRTELQFGAAVEYLENRRTVDGHVMAIAMAEVKAARDPFDYCTGGTEAISSPERSGA